MLFDTLETVLRRVPEHYRDFVLARMDGVSVAEIAGKTGRSERTVLRALARLRELLAEES